MNFQQMRNEDCIWRCDDGSETLERQVEVVGSRNSANCSRLIGMTSKENSQLPPRGRDTSNMSIRSQTDSNAAFPQNMKMKFPHEPRPTTSEWDISLRIVSIRPAPVIRRASKVTKHISFLVPLTSAPLKQRQEPKPKQTKQNISIMNSKGKRHPPQCRNR